MLRQCCTARSPSLNSAFPYAALCGTKVTTVSLHRAFCHPVALGQQDLMLRSPGPVLCSSPPWTQFHMNTWIGGGEGRGRISQKKIRVPLPEDRGARAAQTEASAARLHRPHAAQTGVCVRAPWALVKMQIPSHSSEMGLEILHFSQIPRRSQYCWCLDLPRVRSSSESSLSG